MLVTVLSLSLTGAAEARPPASATWEPMLDDPVKVECTEHQGEPWCRSTGVIGAPIAEVFGTLKSLDENAKAFESLRSVRRVEPDTLHVVIDFPGLISDRDYVARYTHTTEDGGVELLAWEPVAHPDAPVERGVVRLDKMAGEWRLEPKGDKTLVTYLWQAELGGSFPSFAVPIARRKTGQQVLGDLAKTRGATLSKP